MSKSCAIIGCIPLVFPWGFDEEDEYCTAMKLILMHQITMARSEGVTRFRVRIDCGAGLYAAEIINSLRETDKVLELVCVVPFEEQATKWTPEQRDRYFTVLSACTEVLYTSREKAVGCQFDAALQAMKGAGTLLAVYDPHDPRCELEAAAVSVAEAGGIQAVSINPSEIRL